MDFLHHFLLYSEQSDPSFENFRREWKSYRLEYIFHLKHTDEPLSHFLTELFDYLLDALSCEKPCNRSVFCVYIIYVLTTQQPTFEESTKHQFCPMPQYMWPCLNALINYCLLLRKQTSDAFDVLKYLLRNDCFVFCAEKRLRYNRFKSDPYPPSASASGFGTRTCLLPDKTESSFVHLAELSAQRSRYKDAMKRLGPDFVSESDKGSDDLIAKLRKLRVDFARKREVALRSISGLSDHRAVVFPAKERRVKVPTQKTQQTYFECCDAFEKAALFEIPIVSTDLELPPTLPYFGQLAPLRPAVASSMLSTAVSTERHTREPATDALMSSSLHIESVSEFGEQSVVGDYNDDDDADDAFADDAFDDETFVDDQTYVDEQNEDETHESDAYHFDLGETDAFESESSSEPLATASGVLEAEPKEDYLMDGTKETESMPSVALGSDVKKTAKAETQALDSEEKVDAKSKMGKAKEAAEMVEYSTVTDAIALIGRVQRTQSRLTHKPADMSLVKELGALKQQSQKQTTRTKRRLTLNLKRRKGGALAPLPEPAPSKDKEKKK